MALLMLFSLILFGSIAGAIFYLYRLTQDITALETVTKDLSERIGKLENPPKASRR